jgi:hypothetical protein
MRLFLLSAFHAGRGRAAAPQTGGGRRWPFGLGMRLFIAALVLAAAGLFVPARDVLNAAGSGIRLIMVEEKGCRFCRKWDAEIAPAYARSAEGRFAPLKRVRRGAPDIKGLNPVVYTPTFIIVRSGEEIGRITGYPGRDYFWSELQPLLAAAGFAPTFY